MRTVIGTKIEYLFGCNGRGNPYLTPCIAVVVTSLVKALERSLMLHFPSTDAHSWSSRIM